MPKQAGLYQTSTSGIQLIQLYEGLRLHPYKDCVGLLTVGYGHLIGNGTDLTHELNRTITLHEATELLKQDLHKFERGVSRYIKAPISQNQFDALVALAYNLGNGTLQRSTLRQKLNRGDYDGAAKEILKYNKAGGQVLKGLTRRRQAEYRLFTRLDPIRDISA